MSVSMFKISVPIFVQFLTALSAVLEKAAAHCEAKKIEPAALLNARLFPDMFPLVRQVRAATDHAVNAAARLAGAEPLKFDNNEASFSELRERISKAVDFVKVSRPRRSTAPRTRRSRSLFQAARPATSPDSRCCWETRCRIFISTAPPLTTSFATAASK